MANTDKEKYVFISDIHLGDQNSFQPSRTGCNPYGWTNKNTDALSAFLNQLESDPATQGANGVMIVGDLLDTWVCPLSLNPPSFESVLSADHNKDVIRAFNAVADNTSLWYIPGNHDMLIEKEQAALTKYIRNIKLVHPTQGPKYFYDGRLVAEHGHRYCLFNAVDMWSRPKGHLPLGFFMARLSAQGFYDLGRGINYLEFLRREEVNRIVKERAHSIVEEKADGLSRAGLAALVLDALTAYEIALGVKYTDPFLMNFVDNFDAQVAYARVRDIFGDIYNQWERESGSGISAPMATAGDVSAVGLRPAADSKYLVPGYLGLLPVRIAVFGHTHDYGIREGLFFKLEEAAAASAISPKEAEVVYGNCGSWVDGKSCTFIASEKLTVRGETRIYVRGYTYDTGRTHLEDEAYIIVKPCKF